MITVLHCIAGVAIMTLACWASNLWPGKTLWRGCVSRFVWWAIPVAVIANVAGSPPHHALLLGTAAWIGSWMPHTEMPDYHMPPVVFFGDLLMVVLRCTIMLSPITAVFWAIGAFWFEMIKVAAIATVCVYVGALVPSNIEGARQGSELSGVMFGSALGLFIVLAVSISTPRVDLLQ